MARRRDYKAEAARRNELARERGYASYYQERLTRAKKSRKGISKAAARGHGTADERAALRFIRMIPRLNPDAMIAFTGTQRQKDGTWLVARFDVLTDNGDFIFEVGPTGHNLLAAIADTISKTGWANLGAQYLSLMADHGIKLRDSSPVSNPRGAVFADGDRVMVDGKPAFGVDDQGRRKELDRTMSKWRRVR